MIAAQMPAERKRAKSDFVIENEGSLKKLERKARATFDELRHARQWPRWVGDRRACLLLAAADAREQPTLNPIAARYADAGFAVRRVAVMRPRSRRRWANPCRRRHRRDCGGRGGPRHTMGGRGPSGVLTSSPMTPIRSPCARPAPLGRRGSSGRARRGGTSARPICFHRPTHWLDRGSVLPITFAPTPRPRSPTLHGEYPADLRYTKSMNT